jgi:hypothetical protein
MPQVTVRLHKCADTVVIDRPRTTVYLGRNKSLVVVGQVTTAKSWNALGAYAWNDLNMSWNQIEVSL